MNVRYYIGPAAGAPHIYRHGVEEDEVDRLRSPRQALTAYRRRRRKKS